MQLCRSIKSTIAGREFELRFDFNAVIVAEHVTGVNWLDQEKWADLNATKVTALFFACALQTDPLVTLESIRALPPDSAEPLVTAVRAAWDAANDMPMDDTPRPMNGHELKRRVSELVASLPQ